MEEYLKRQYTQLIALFDNWDAYKYALNVSETSEGTLAKQAETFAEGWEAARRRVKAAAEGIYDSLIDPQVMIKVDNMLVSIFNRIENIIDGMGGFGGTVSSVSYLLLTAFGSKLENSLRTAYQGLTDLTGKQREYNDEVRQSFVREAMSITNGNEQLKQRFSLLLEYEQKRKNMTDTQQAEIDINLKIYDYILDQLEGIQNVNKELTKQQTIYETISQNIQGIDYHTQDQQFYSNKIRNAGNRESLIEDLKLAYKNRYSKEDLGDDSLTSIAERRLYEEEQRILSVIKERAKIMGGIEQTNKRIQAIKAQARQEDTLTKNLNTEQRTIIKDIVSLLSDKTKFNISDNFIQPGENIGEFKKSLMELTQLVDSSDVPWQELEDKIRKVMLQLLALQQSPLPAWLISTQEDIKGLTSSMNQSGQNIIQEEELLKRLETQFQNTDAAIKQTTSSQRDWASTILTISRTLSSLGMAFSSVTSLGRTWNDFAEGNISLLDTLTRSLTSVGMLLPMIVQGFTKLTTAASSGAGIIGKLATVTGSVGAAVGLTGGAIAVLVTVLGLAIKAYDNYAHAEQKAREAINEVREQTNEQKQVFEDLNDELQTTKERIEELEKQDTLTFVEQEELDKLYEAEASLERQAAAEERLYKAQLRKEIDVLREKGDKSTKSVVEGISTGDFNRMMTLGGINGLQIMNIQAELDEDDPLYKLIMNDEEIEVVLTSTFGDDYSLNPEEGFVDVDTWWESLSEAQQEMEFFQLYRDRWVESNQASVDKWVTDNEEGLQLIEDNYATYLAGYENGLVKEEELNEQRNRLAQARRNEYFGNYEAYEKAYVLPELNRKDFKDEYNKIINDIIQTGNFGDKLSDELTHSLYKAGIPVEDFLNGVQKNLNQLKDNLSSFMNSGEIESFLEILSPDDLALLFTLNFTGLDTFEDFYNKFLEVKAGARVQIDLEIAKEEAENALVQISKGEFLDEETIASLQEKFIGLYDFSNLKNLSLYDQAKQIGEALIIASNPVDIYNQKLEESEQKLDEIKQKIKEQKQVQEALVSIRQYHPIPEQADKEILELEKSLKDLEQEKIEVEVDITEAENNLEKLAELSDIDIQLEVDSAMIDSIVSQMGAIANAASLIGEGFKVEAENVQELIRTMPQLLEDATIDMETGMVQLQQSIVEKVAETAQQEVALTAEALRQKLSNRYNEIQGEIDLLNSVKQNAFNAKREEVTNDEVWNNIEKENKIKVVQAIIKARIQQAIQTTSQSAQEASNQIQGQNKVTEASKEQGLQTQENWRKTAENAAKYFRQFAISAVQSQNAITQNRMPDSYVNIRALGAVGFSANASDLSWNYDTSAGAKYATTSKFLENDFHLWEAGTPEAIDLANTISKELAELGFNLDTNIIQQGTETAIDSFISSNYDNWKDFTQDIDTALSDRFYELGIVGEDISRLLAGIGNTETLKTSGIKEDKGSKGSEKEDKIAKGSELKEKQEEEIERYHEINKLLEYQGRLLDEVQTQIERTYGAAKLKEYNKEQKKLNDLIESETKKMEEAKGWAEFDLAAIKKLGMNPIISDDGRLLNYTELLTQATKEYNDFVDLWNSHQNEVLKSDINGEYQKSWQEQHEEEKKQMEQLYNDKLEALKKFEESVKTYWDEFDKREQYLRDLEDNKLKKIAYVLEFQIDYKNAKKDVRNLAKTIEEAFGDALTHGMKTAVLDYQNMLDEMGMKEHYDANFDQLLAKIEKSRTNQYIDQEELANQLANLRDNVIASAEALVDWAENLEKLLPDAIDAARERFDQFTDQLEHNTSIIDTIKEIMVLQGLTIKTAQGYNDTRDMYNKRMDATLAQAKLNRKWYDNALRELQIAQTELDSAVEGTEQYDILKANRDALLEEFKQSQQAMLDSAKETMETAREMYIDGVERTAYELEQILTKGDGFDLLQDKYDHYIDTEERYLDTVNKIYETTKLNNKIQEQLDKTTNAAHAKRLKELQEEFREREKNNKLSEYDIEIMNAKLQMLMKQMDLEDAANNKSVARLVRNSRGNYDYQFTANPDELAQINQEYLDAAQEYYNIAKNQVKEVSGEIIDTWQEMTEKIKEIYEDETLTVDEREARIAEIREYYTQKVKDLESEKQKAILDMTEAGNIAINDFRDAHKNVLGDMGEDVDSFRDLFSDDLASILENQKEFNNTFATDLDKLSEPIQNFEEVFDNTIDNMNDHVKEYEDKVTEVNQEVGVSYDDLKGILDQVADSTEQVTWRGEEAVQNMWEQIAAVQQLSIEYANMADSVLQAAQALHELAQATLEAQFDRLGNADEVNYGNKEFFDDNALYNQIGGANIDYSALMSYALASGQLQYGSDVYKQLMDFRDIAYGDRGGSDKGWISNSELDEIFKNYTSGNLSGSNLDWFNQASGNYTGPYENNLGDFLYWLKRHGIQGYATGGYTGDFDNGKLAILHEKELVLNQDDTKNILDAVNTVRNSDISIWTTIAKTLDTSIALLKNALSSILTPSIKVERDKDTLEQKVDIHAEFPNVTDSNEIEEALSHIINDAAQFISQRD